MRRLSILVNVSLVEGYGHLSQKALKEIIPYLESEVITFDKAVEKIGIDHSDFGLKTNEEDVEYVDHIVKSTGRFSVLPAISSFRIIMGFTGKTCCIWQWR